MMRQGAIQPSEDALAALRREINKSAGCMSPIATIPSTRLDGSGTDTPLKSLIVAPESLARDALIARRVPIECRRCEQEVLSMVVIFGRVVPPV